jgi:hypothetical protein
MTRAYLVRRLAFGALALLLFVFGRNDLATGESPAAPTDIPQRMTYDPLQHWTMDDVFYYWANRSPECDVFIPLGSRAATAASTLKRQPLNGGTVLALGNEPQCAFSPLAADASGVFHEWNQNQQQTSSMVVRARNLPDVPAPVVSGIDPGVTKLVPSGDHLYWAQGNKVYRALKAGGAAMAVASLPSGVSDFVVNGGQLIVADLSAVYFVNPGCQSPPCAADYVTAGPFSHVLDGGPGALAGVFHVVQSASQQLQKLSCTAVGNDWQCKVDVLHDSPAGWHISGLAALCVPKLGGFCQGYTSYFVAEISDALSDSRILRGSGNGPLQEIAIGTYFADGIYLNDGYVYWAERTGASGIYRLPYSAAPLERDLEAAAMEVTQAIQNLENEVPLVAGKETYVIVHGSQLSGPPALTVETVLNGSRNGSPLPGSPLQPTNLPVRLVTGGTLDRFDLDGAWVFKLPPTWTTTGPLNLTAVVDNRQAYSDANRDNNTTQGTFTFNNEPDACLLMSPVRTHASLPQPTDPNFWPTIDRFQSLWPTDRTQIYWLGEPIEEAELCWKGICFGPYELSQGWELDNFPPDKDRVIMKLVARHALTLTEPLTGLGCDTGLLDPVFAVGMVHPDSNTTVTDDGKTLTYSGYAWPLVHASWVKFPDHFPQSTVNFDWPYAGGTLAHEVSHNLLRRHVDCPAGKPDGPDDDYPYNPCLLDDGAVNDPDTHFGFDPISRQPVPPTAAADIMSYANKRWVSDYTYKAVRSATFLSAVQRQAARNELAAAGEIVYISGFYDPDYDMGGLNYAYELAAENLDTARLARMLAPRVSSGIQSTPAGVSDIPGTLRLRAPNGTVLEERQVQLVPNEDYGEETGYFTATFPAPTGTVAKVELVVGGKVVAETAPGTNAPQVTILEPAAGANLDQTIRIRWRATDPDGDQLLHTVHYSPDNGQTWLALVTDYADQLNTAEVTLDLQSPDTVPGTSTTSLIKIASSDGYNTTEVTSAPFSVANRPPVAGISLPQPAMVYDAGTSVSLRGNAYDAEEGLLSGSSLKWFLDGVQLGAGTTISLTGLAPGTFNLSLQATSTFSLTAQTTGAAVTAATAQSASTQTTLHVAPLSVPAASVTPGLDGRCDDSAYTEAAQVGLKPYQDGQATVQMTRTETDLWACFSGMMRAPGSGAGIARLLLDGNYDHGGPVQGLDVGFQVGEDGTPQRLQGVNSTGGWETVADLGGFNAEITAEEFVWRAEMRIPLALISASDSQVGLYLSHNVEGPGVSAWPYAASYTEPGTWAQTILGDQPRLDDLAPLSALVGDKKLELTLTGRNFATDAVVLWDGAPLPTTVVSPTELSATVGAGLLDTAGTFPVTVRNPDLPAIPSESHSVVVLHVVPGLSTLSPSSADAGSQSLLLTVNGSGFAPGAVVYWNGEARQTAFVSTSILQASIREVDLSVSGQVGVTVRNPDPSAGQSPTLFFTLHPAEIERVILLPVTLGGK